MKSIMTALAPLESRHPRLGQSLWWLWVMRPRCLHVHAAPAGVLVCPAGRRGEVSLPSVASSPRAGGRTGAGRWTPLGFAPPPSPVCVSLAFWGLGVVPPPRPGVLWLALRTPRRRSGVGARPAAGGHIAGTRGCPWCPRAQQCRTLLCAIAHALHGGCPCASCVCMCMCIGIWTGTYHLNHWFETGLRQGLDKQLTPHFNSNFQLYNERALFLHLRRMTPKLNTISTLSQPISTRGSSQG